MSLEKDLERAAEQPRARLERDREELARKGETALVAVLAYLQRNLFRPDLTAQEAATVAGTCPSWVSRQLQRHLGQTCHDYYSARRYETARIMLATDPGLALEKVTELVGGLRGKWLRRLSRECSRHSPTISRDRCSIPFVLRFPTSWKRLLQGELTFAEQQELGPQLRDAFPDVFPTATREAAEPTPGVDYVPSPAIGLVGSIGDGAPGDGADLARAVAEHEVWPVLTGLPYDAQRLVVERYAFRSTELFDLLREKSRQEGRSDRQRGIELAELALLSLEVSAPALGERIHELRALGRAWVGNARRLALEFSGAEEAFEDAFAQLALVKDWEDSVVAADVYALKGSLRIFQRRFKEALELLDRSLAIFERAGDRRRQTEQLMKRAAAASYAGWSEMAVSDLSLALAKAKELRAEDLSVMVVISLGATLVDSGQFERGAAVVAGIDRSSCQVLNPLFFHQIECIEAIAEHGLGNASAEKKYLAARAGFEALGQRLFSGFVDLDLAILYAQTSKPADVVRTSAAALRFFEALTLGREVMLSLGLLRDGLHHETVTEAMLLDLRSTLRADPLIELWNKAGPEPISPGPQAMVGL